MSGYTIELIRDVKKCKMHGFNEPILIVSNPRVSTAIPATKVSWNTIAVAVQRCERRPSLKESKE